MSAVPHAAPDAQPNNSRLEAHGLQKRYGPRGSWWQDHPDVPKRPIRTWQIWNEPHLRFQWGNPIFQPILQTGYPRKTESFHLADNNRRFPRYVQAWLLPQ